jgi:hypothetical protein
MGPPKDRTRCGRFGIGIEKQALPYLSILLCFWAVSNILFTQARSVHFDLFSHKD